MRLRYVQAKMAPSAIIAPMKLSSRGREAPAAEVEVELALEPVADPDEEPAALRVRKIISADS